MNCFRNINGQGLLPWIITGKSKIQNKIDKKSYSNFIDRFDKRNDFQQVILNFEASKNNHRSPNKLLTFDFWQRNKLR